MAAFGARHVDTPTEKAAIIKRARNSQANNFDERKKMKKKTNECYL